LISSVTPELSVVIFTPDTFETIRHTIRHLQQQTVCDRLELLIAAPSRDAVQLVESEMEPFLRWEVVEVGPVEHLAAAKIGAIQRASAPVIAFAEDHSYPDSGWAAALIEAHKAGWSAVGPAMGNANPDCALSWAGLFLSFGPWVEPVAAGPVTGLPWHNTSYPRDLLLGYGERLVSMLTVESLLQADMLARGYSLYLNPAARTQHLNMTRPSSFLAEQFHGARAYAAYRARHSSWPAWVRRWVTLSGRGQRSSGSRSWSRTASATCSRTAGRKAPFDRAPFPSSPGNARGDRARLPG
jgi:hypothetical protein